MTNTDNYNLIIVEGTDKVNPLTQVNPNFETIDNQMKENSDAGVQSATELTSGTVHAITRLQGDAPVFRFTATSRFTAGDTFTVDGVQVSALTTSGEQLPDGAYVIGAEVLCTLKGSVMTVYCSINTVANATNAQKLNGQSADYYATAEDVENAQETATSAGNLASQNAQSIVNINSNLSKVGKRTLVWNNPNPNVTISKGDSSPINGINLSDYDEFEIYASTSTSYHETITCKIAGNTDKCDLIKLVLSDSFINSILYSRTIKITKSTNIIHIDTCYKNTNTTTDDSHLIPFAIYGIKY